MTATLNPGEESQLLQTIEMFEVITQSQPQDYQSLEILKEAYMKLGREDDTVNTSRRIAQAYVHLGQLSSAILEYESILQRRPDDADVLAALGDIESRASSLNAPEPEVVLELAEPTVRVQPTEASIAGSADLASRFATSPSMSLGSIGLSHSLRSAAGPLASR